MRIESINAPVDELGQREFIYPNGAFCCPGFQPGPGAFIVEKVGKKAAGHLLDGREWREMPELVGGEWTKEDDE